MLRLLEDTTGGAPVEDIIALSALNVSMDITTFLNLNPDVIKALNVSTVISLMGQNKADLKLFENSTTVRMWVAQQYNSELAVLGLSGGKADPVSSTAAPATTVTTVLTNTTITQTNQTVNTTVVWFYMFVLWCVVWMDHWFLLQESLMHFLALPVVRAVVVKVLVVQQNNVLDEIHTFPPSTVTAVGVARITLNGPSLLGPF
ncbi:hypothetical protein MHYP_G00105780 [Metynnis hypsauchen]